jgi:hypothetical protein
LRYWFVGIICFFAAFYAVLIPSFENPDETSHYHWIDTFDGLNIQLEGDGNSYYWFQNKVQNIFHLESTYETLDKNYEFSYFNNDYRYMHNLIYPPRAIIIHRLSNLLIFLPIFFLFARTKITKEILALLLCFPGFVWFLTAINSDVPSVGMAFLLFMCRKSKTVSTLLLVTGYFMFDRTFILVVIAYISASCIHAVSFRSNRLVVPLSVLGLIFSLIAVKNAVASVFLMENVPFEVLKSSFTVSVSFYGLLGNMSIKAFLLEYMLLFFLLGGVFLTIFRELLGKKERNKDLHFASLVVVCYATVWFYIMSFAPVLDQGRYFYLIAPFIGLLMCSTLHSWFGKIKWTSYILVSLVTNSLMVGQIVYSFIKHKYI